MKELDSLYQLHDRHVVRLLAHAVNESFMSCTNPCALMLELMDGDLKQHLRSADGHTADRETLTARERIQVMVDVARGIYYLHHYKANAAVLHHDIKPGNIGLSRIRGANAPGTRTFVAKLMDCGLAKMTGASVAHEVEGASMYLGGTSVGGCGGTRGYMDPCLTPG